MADGAAIAFFQFAGVDKNLIGRTNIYAHVALETDQAGQDAIHQRLLAAGVEHPHHFTSPRRWEAPAVSYLIVNSLLPDCSEEQRLSVRDRHLTYVSDHRVLIELSSRTHSPDGHELTGGFFLLRTDGVWSPAIVASVEVPVRERSA